MNKELADFGNAPSGPMMHFQAAQPQFTMAKPRAVNQPTPADVAADAINCAKSMNSDAFSHFSSAWRTDDASRPVTEIVKDSEIAN
mgnify:CR=1 FL=1